MADKDKSKKSLPANPDQAINQHEVQRCGHHSGGSGEERTTKASGLARTPESHPERNGFLETLQRHLNAVVFAEAGEFQSARELLECRPRNRSILLVIEGDAPDRAAFAYSLGVCTRMGAELDILQVIPASDGTSDDQITGEDMPNGTENLAALALTAREKSIPCKVTTKVGDLSDKLINYAKRHKNVAMIIIDSHRTRTTPRPERAWGRFLRNLSRALSVPITTVLPLTLSGYDSPVLSKTDPPI